MPSKAGIREQSHLGCKLGADFNFPAGGIWKSGSLEMIHPPPSHRRHLPSRCVLSPAVPPSPNHFAAASPSGCLRLGASVLPRVPKRGAGAKRDLGRAAGASGCYRWYAGLVGSGPGAPAAWLVPDAEQAGENHPWGAGRCPAQHLGAPGATRGSPKWVPFPDKHEVPSAPKGGRER